ncbi:MAG: hypothetical protein A2860_01310 [Candidatus Levybacteria bacterium RIFCSPHIGHO2_01_FULL_37_33]|nr:MAG: hypothetical protein A2860_01310 [Candidatus Levybacteria bacterium RIFCSPHIGHO2_01_FULL_37_33]OGH16423.1 MAG: hypothetical protein A3C97_02825 [Candidatus Levybacteria bacterium RIFCSPHIGHO2_02_FULL_37_11]OGH29717.1 MAG: hypothetical protein A3F30_03770 [Candidatus Levybacteria bacterium RIFCSPHIGHO2_12_FULL_37_12]OGH32691.1 MAG: hypothetical protein A2953_00670 [Candidatus Levybacteria bacterium RIFCSPLOWO2_01_FULL_36_54]
MQRIIVSDESKGIEIVGKKIYKFVDQKTVLFLSGGSTPKLLYQKFASEKILKPGAVAMVDERYGNPFHQNSNEKMIRETGFLSYLEEKKIPFYSILRLHPKGVASDIARDYDKAVRDLFNKFQKRVAILGIGSDGHTAGLPAGKSQITPASPSEAGRANLKSQKLATSFEDFPGESKERISLTFDALSKMNLLMVQVFGKEKRKALKLLFSEGSIAEVPARFLKTPFITDRTLLITDQRV